MFQASTEGVEMSMHSEALDASVLKAQPRGDLFWRRIRTVVVDDIPSLLEATCAVLESDGLVEIVGRARDGAEAVRAVAQLDPELVVMDVNMAGMNGLDAASLISHHFPRTRIMLMSGEESPEIRYRSQACGADAFVFKVGFPQAYVSLLRKIFPGHGQGREFRMKNNE
jgi:DNA-binding NarL/FixJ family response regulator